mmetsp:Transcript_43103/g.99269  ORF Transcript_43103/g.99269 Transcript_43103/m.99269 type:complete len:286 (+) Transcript_43103:90-947(+)
MSPRRPDTIPEAEPDVGAVNPSAIVAEAVVDIHEYGLSLNVDIDNDDEEDLGWVVQEAFHAPLPCCWTEYMDPSGRAYYVKDGTNVSTWAHPMDEVYRDVLELVKKVRSGAIPNSTETQRESVIKSHLQDIVARAKEDLQGWSGPYPSDLGDYFHNERSGFSSWINPVADWEQELKIRHAILFRCLLPERAMRSAQQPALSAGMSGSDVVVETTKSKELLQSLRLQLGDIPRIRNDGDVPQTPLSVRSYHTAKSAASSRSGRTLQDSDRKERKQRRERTASHTKS